MIGFSVFVDGVEIVIGLLFYLCVFFELAWRQVVLAFKLRMAVFLLILLLFMNMVQLLWKHWLEHIQF